MGSFLQTFVYLHRLQDLSEDEIVAEKIKKAMVSSFIVNLLSIEIFHCQTRTIFFTIKSNQASSIVILRIKVILHGPIFNAKNRYRVTWQLTCCKNVVDIWSLFKVVEHVVATNAALNIDCRRHVTRIDFLCNNIALKIVVRNRPV